MDADRLSADRSADPNQRHLLPRDESRSGGCRTVVLHRGEPQALDWAADRLIEGGVIAFPTDTVYGIGASLAHEAALRRIFAIKGRPRDRPLPVLLSSAGALERIALTLDERVELLLERYWPGPLTVIVPAREGMPAEVRGPGNTVGARVPNHPVALELIERAGGAIATTSANRSGQAAARTAAEVVAALDGALDLLLDGGPTPGGVPSTVVAVHAADLVVVREGAIASEHLQAAWDERR